MRGEEGSGVKEGRTVIRVRGEEDSDVKEGRTVI